MSIERFTEMVNECESIVFFGGAGVSTESGIKDYRSRDGLYNTVKDYSVSPEVILSRDFFEEHPEIFYDFYRKYFITDAEPNKAHIALARLEALGKLKAVITQNIDNLHQKAGSKNVIELHGTTDVFFCHTCRRPLDREKAMSDIISEKVPRCNYCNGVARPKVVLYGERLYDDVIDNAISYIEKADMLIIGGTSLAVHPAASFLSYFRGKYTVIINKSATAYDERADLVFKDSIGTVLEEMMHGVKK